MYSKWRRKVKRRIDAEVKQAVDYLYNMGVSVVKIGYPRNIAQENESFITPHPAY